MTIIRILPYSAVASAVVFVLRERCCAVAGAAAASILLVVSAAAYAIGDDRAEVSFERDVRPILASKCFKCHGADDGSREAGLRLDVRAAATSELASGARAIVPNDAEQSELLTRVTASDESLRMPPNDAGDPLSAEQIATLREWIAAGAKYSEHWAFTSPDRPTLPQVKNDAWVRNAIDRFVLARLEAEGMSPSPEADKTTLLRRLSLDLTGLPPTITELDAFGGDEPDYEAEVEHRLESPHYGERWARLWLDAARYADSDGFEKDKSRQVWFYRDWVIQALNDDMPYDQFIIQQVAGDLLPDATQDNRVATGFLRNSMINEEGGIDPEQFRMEAMFDRMDAIGKSVLGLTIQCAQCHSHKYDPLSQEEYYRMFAFLNDAHEANIAVYTPDEQLRRAEMFRQITDVDSELKRRAPDWRERMSAWEAMLMTGAPQWTTLRPKVDEPSTGGQKYLLLDDGSLLAQGYAPTHHRVKLTAESDSSRIAAIRLELLMDPNLPRGGPGRSIWGTGALTEFEVDVAPLSAPGETKRIKFKFAFADVNPPETQLAAIFDDRSGENRTTGPIEFAIDGKRETAWGIDIGPGRRNQPRQAVFVPETTIEHAGGAMLTIYLAQNHGGWNSDDNQSNNLGRVRLSLADTAPSSGPLLPANVQAILAIPDAQRTERQVDTLFSYWRTTLPEWQTENQRIEALWSQHPDGTTQLALATRDAPRTTYVLNRGSFLDPDRAVSPGVPAFLHPLAADASPTRLTFAQWLVDRRSPTAARSIVNRVWQAYFGVGLVETSEDLGTQSAPPSHPELLDWLAVEFMDSGWSLKRLHRLIVDSATYRQSSRVTSELLAHDPYNRLLARGARHRVDAEIVRDVMLSASGLLNPGIGGPSVFPPAPDFLFQPPVSYGPKVWDTATGPERHRRALYTFRYRSVPYPPLQTFDAPNGDASCVRRSRSNTPLQALVTLNEPLSMECARGLARRMVSDGAANDAERLEYGFRCCVARPPTTDEASELLRFYSEQKLRIAAGWLNAWQLTGNAVASPDTPRGVSPTELAAWTAVARVLLNLDETITRQ